jgi:hypothetical protein
MKNSASLALCFSLFGSFAWADTRALFFAHETAKEFTRIALSIEDGQKVSGTRVWQPKEDHGASGFLDGIVNGNVIQVLYAYTIEGSEQSEEMVLKIEGDKLLIGEGELVDAGNGRMNLKAPNIVSFKTTLKKLPVTEPKPGTPERKAMMDAMRVEVADYAGKPVTFTGKLRTLGNWARFTGKVTPADGKPVEAEGIAADMELDFVALLQKDAAGQWTAPHWGFAGDTSVLEEAKEKFPKAPWPMFEWME